MGCGPSKMAASAVSPQQEAAGVSQQTPSDDVCESSELNDVQEVAGVTQQTPSDDECVSSESEVVPGLKKAFASDHDFAKTIVRMETSDELPIESVYDIDYEEEPLGFGAGGVVRRARHIATNEYFAVKCLEKGRANTVAGLDELRNEISIMCELDHPNIVRIEEVYETPDMLYIVQELCTGGDLFDRLEDHQDKQSHFSEAQCTKMVRQMAAAVSYLHKHGIVHRDLKLENFLYASKHESSELVMIDFGLSKHFEMGQHHHESVGTPYTVAPEIIRRDYDEKVDIWALGVLTYLILSGETPFGGLDGEDNKEVKTRILQGRLDFDSSGLWAGVSDSAKCFVRALLNLEPAQRPTATQILRDPWIKHWTNDCNVLDGQVDDKLQASTVEAMLAFKGLTALEKFQSEILSFTLFPDQIVELRKEFDKIDTDGAGEVSLVALQRAVTDRIDSEALGAAFESIKLRKDALTLRWHEFLAAMISLAHVDERNIRLAFDRLDHEGKGYLTLEDLSGVLESFTDRWDDLQRTLLPRSVGVDGAESDHISYTDFKRKTSSLT